MRPWKVERIDVTSTYIHKSTTRFMRLTELTQDHVRHLYLKCGYPFHEKGDFNVNFFGVRQHDADSSVAGQWDDVLGVMYRHPKKGWLHMLYEASVDAGSYYCQNPLNKYGTANMKEGYYRGLYARGLHNKRFEALRQVSNVTVYRDNNRDNVIDLDPSTTQHGMFFTNVHCSFESRQNYKSSAGCQVTKARYSDDEYWQFLWHFDESAKIWGNKFSYALFNAKDLA